MRRIFIEQLAMYAAFHRDRRNQLTHHIGVPVIVFSLMVLAGRVILFQPGGMSVTLASLLLIALLIFYIGSAPLIGYIAAILYGILLVLAQSVAAMGWETAFAVFLACFVGGWALQLVGHAFEGRKPALVHNLAQIFFAPAFLIAEPLFAIGAERELKHAIEARQQDYLAGSPAEREPRR